MSEERHAVLDIHAIHDTDPAELMKRRRIVRRAKVLMAVALLLLAIGAARTLLIRTSGARALAAATTELAAQYVRVTTPQTGRAGQSVLLPATLQGYAQTPIAARASGYLKRWTRDIGSRVEKGELLAEIDAPEIDQQLAQAIAAREQAASGLMLAKSTVERWEALRRKDAVSQQDLDERRSAEAQARASLASAQANVERLRELEAFKRVVAPFAGVVTRRNIDVGDLIDTAGGGRVLFVLTQSDPLRVYVNVPQSYAQLVKPGQDASVTQTELRGRAFAGKVVRTAGAIDAASRTMQIEIQLPNRDGALLPGAYVQVSLALPSSPALTVSANTLVMRAGGTRVAVVDAENKVRLRAVKIGRNYGESVEVLEGVSASDRLVLNPADSIAEGDAVKIAPAAQERR